MHSVTPFWGLNPTSIYSINFEHVSDMYLIENGMHGQCNQSLVMGDGGKRGKIGGIFLFLHSG